MTTTYQSSLKLGSKPGAAGEGPGEFASAFHAVTAPSGCVFGSDFWNHRILVFGPDGGFQRVISGKGFTEGTIMFPMGLAIRGEELFVVEGLNHRVSVFTLDGQFRRTFGEQGDGIGQMLYPTAIAVSEDTVFCSDHGNDRVVSFNAQTGEPLSSWGGTGPGEGQFRGPMGMVFLDRNEGTSPEDGRSDEDRPPSLCVADKDRLQFFAPDGTFLKKFDGSHCEGVVGVDVTAEAIVVSVAGSARCVRAFQRESGEFLGESKVADASGALYLISACASHILVADYEKHCVHLMTLGDPFSGDFHVPEEPAVVISTAVVKPLLCFGELGASPGQINYPYQAVCASSGDIHVCDQFNHRISCFAAHGTYKFSYGAKGAAPGKFMYPMGLAASAAGDVYVSDGGGRRIQVFSADGQFQGIFGDQACGKGALKDPLGLALCDTEVFVVDYGDESVKVYKRGEGTFLRQWGEPGVGNGQFVNPQGITIHDSKVYVSDIGRVQVFSTDGTFLSKLDGPQLEGAGGVAVTADCVYVSILTVGTATVRVFSHDGNFLREISPEGGVGLGLLNLDNAGNLIVTDEKRHRVYVMAR